MKNHIIGSIIIKRLTKFNVSSDFVDGMDEYIKKGISEAEKRATGNDRMTLMRRDL